LEHLLIKAGKLIKEIEIKNRTMRKKNDIWIENMNKLEDTANFILVLVMEGVASFFGD